MFDAVRRNKRISQVILAIIIVPFAFFGMDAYFSDTPGGVEVAKIDGVPISMMQFDQALREQQDRLREAAGGQVDRAVFESEGFRRSVLDNLINQRLLANYAADSRLVVTAEQLQEVIASMAAFQEDGRFSLSRYEALLRSQGMSPAMFESRLAQDLRVQQIARSVGESAIVGRASARQFLLAQLEERSVREIRLSAQDFAAEVVVDDAALKAYYDANAANFERPARVKTEYLVLDEATIAGRAVISEEAVAQFYAANVERFGQPEERRARHILLLLDADAGEEETKAVGDKAAALLVRLREDPSQFEALARSESQDPGSAKNGGDLGFISRGAMVPPFENAVFALQADQISEVVRTDFGFHIIQLTAIKPTTVRPLEEVRAEIVAELSRQEASRQFAAKAELFANTVYEQADSLQPAAEALGLEIRSSDWVSRDEGSIGGFRTERLINALFSDDVLTKRHNAEAIEVERGTLVSARVIEFEAEQRLAFDTVKDEIASRLRAQGAQKLAQERGEALLEQARKGGVLDRGWSEPRTLTRAEPDRATVQAVFGVPASSVPAHVGVATGDGGFGLFHVESVKRPELADDDPRLEALTREYQRLAGQREFLAFLDALRDRHKVEIRAAALQSEPRQ